MSKKILRYVGLSVFVILLSNKIFSQERCATQLYNQQLKKQYPQLAAISAHFDSLLNQQSIKNLRQAVIEDTLVTISVVVHVIHHTADKSIGGEGNSNISDAQIFSQIDVLNEDYRKKPGTAGYNDNPVGADTKINFCLATKDPAGNPSTGINRIYTEDAFYNADSYFDNNKIKSFIHWPAEKYLNLYVVILSVNYVGYAQFPYDSGLPGLNMDSDPGFEKDGVVIDFRAFGRIGTATKAPYHLGRTATHEIGHWLGLRHIWGDGNGCETDYVDDTPIDEKPNDPNGDCIDSSVCGGKKTADMSNNYLDYSNDKCMNIFTNVQSARIHSVLKLSAMRNSVIHNQSCGLVNSINKSDDEENYFTIFPNPSQGIFNYKIHSDKDNKIEVEIFNAIGQKIFYNELLSTESLVGEIDLQKFESGLYIFKIKDGVRMMSKKVVLRK